MRNENVHQVFRTALNSIQPSGQKRFYTKLLYAEISAERVDSQAREYLAVMTEFLDVMAEYRETGTLNFHRLCEVRNQAEEIVGNSVERRKEPRS